MKTYEIIENELMLVHGQARKQISNMRELNKDDYGVEYNCFGICIGDDLILTIHDMIRILQYEITKEIVRKWRDMRTLTHYTPRVQEAIDEKKTVKDYNIITFWRMFGGSKAKTQQGKEIKESKKKLKEIEKIRKNEVKKIKSQSKPTQ